MEWLSCSPQDGKGQGLNVQDMDTESIRLSMTMLDEVLSGRSYVEVAAAHGVTRSAVELRIKTLAKRLSRDVGIKGMNASGAVMLLRLRAHKEAVREALARFDPHAEPGSRQEFSLTMEELREAIKKLRARSSHPERDMAMVAVLLGTGIGPLEVARLEIRDYLNLNGSVREKSVLRAEVAKNRTERPLFFTSAFVRSVIDAYLATRADPMGMGVAYRGLNESDRLFLTGSGKAFQIEVMKQGRGQRFLCRQIHDDYRKIFQRIGLPGLTATGVRRMVICRLSERGADLDEIGELLGLGMVERKKLRAMLVKSSVPVGELMQTLI